MTKKFATFPSLFAARDNKNAMILENKAKIAQLLVMLFFVLRKSSGRPSQSLTVVQTHSSHMPMETGIQNEKKDLKAVAVDSPNM